jgi:hypothetical protein
VSDTFRTPALLATTGGSLNVSADLCRSRSSAGTDLQFVIAAETRTIVEAMRAVFQCVFIRT